MVRMASPFALMVIESAPTANDDGGEEDDDFGVVMEAFWSTVSPFPLLKLLLLPGSAFTLSSDISTTSSIPV